MRLAIIVLLSLTVGSYTLLFAPTTQAAPLPQLSAAEAAGLAFMREEEKLAHDLYLALAKSWSLPIFQKIGASELVHTNAIKNLLNRYGLADPAAGNAAGVFANAELQALYTKLLARGNSSLPEALAVGAAVEELDILDLQKRMTSSTPADIVRVYTRLSQGSYRHLRAFVTQWQNQTSKTYQPQYLDAATYKSIIGADNAGDNDAENDTSTGNCRGNGNANGGGNGSGRGQGRGRTNGNGGCRP